jgi:hypothetical protein
MPRKGLSYIFETHARVCTDAWSSITFEFGELCGQIFNNYTLSYIFTEGSCEKQTQNALKQLKSCHELNH